MSWCSVSVNCVRVACLCGVFHIGAGVTWITRVLVSGICRVFGARVSRHLREEHVLVVLFHNFLKRVADPLGR